MQRNRYIYCLADAAVAVSSSVGKGGTWNGATENLKSDWVPLWVAPTEDSRSGNPELVRLGAKWLPNGTTSVDELIRGASAKPPGDAAVAMTPGKTSDDKRRPPKRAEGNSNAASLAVELPSERLSSPLPHGHCSSSVLYELFLKEFGKISVGQPLSGRETAEMLGLTLKQAQKWLECGGMDGRIKRYNRPVRFQAKEHTVEQDSLFDLRLDSQRSEGI